MTPGRRFASPVAVRCWVLVVTGLTACADRDAEWGEATQFATEPADSGDDDVRQIAAAAGTSDRWVGPTHRTALAAATADTEACTAYCRAYDSTCGASPFADPQKCIDRCAAWPIGQADETGDTLACRAAMLTGAGSCIAAGPNSPICRPPRLVRATSRSPEPTAL